MRHVTADMFVRVCVCGGEGVTDNFGFAKWHYRYVYVCKCVYVCALSAYWGFRSVQMCANLRVHICVRTLYVLEV